MDKAAFQTTPIETGQPDDEWTLTAEQMLFFLQHHNAIEAAFANDDTAWVEEFMVSAEYRAVFGEMGFDEAFDRYECSLDEGQNGVTSVASDI